MKNKDSYIERRLGNLKAEQQASLEILSKNVKIFKHQFQESDRLLKGSLIDASLTERVHKIFCEQDITIVSILTALSMTSSTTALAIIGVEEETLLLWVNPSKR